VVIDVVFLIKGFVRSISMVGNCSYLDKALDCDRMGCVIYLYGGI